MQNECLLFFSFPSAGIFDEVKDTKSNLKFAIVVIKSINGRMTFKLFYYLSSGEICNEYFKF